MNLVFDTDTEAALYALADAVRTRGWRLAEEAIAANEATLAQRGMTVTQPSPVLLEALNRVGVEMAREWVTRAGEDGARLIAAYNG